MEQHRAPAPPPAAAERLAWPPRCLLCRYAFTALWQARAARSESATRNQHHAPLSQQWKVSSQICVCPPNLALLQLPKVPQGASWQAKLVASVRALGADLFRCEVFLSGGRVANCSL